MNKTAYFYWGSEVMSYLRYMTFYTFRAHHPDWKMVLVKRRNQLKTTSYGWAETQDFMFEPLQDFSGELDRLDIDIEWLEDSYPEIAVLDISDVHTSDILSWYVLATRGGVVSDTDIIYVGRLPYEKYKEADVGLICFENLPAPNYIPVSFMMSRPNEFFKQIYEASLRLVDKSSYESAGTSVITKTVGGFKDIVSGFSGLNIVRLPSKLVFPFSENYPWHMYASMAFHLNLYHKLDKDCIGIHWYAGAPGNQKFNMAYSDGNYALYPNTISAAIDEAVRILE